MRGDCVPDERAASGWWCCTYSCRDWKWALVPAVDRPGLPNLWVPAERDFYPVPELPVLGSGKVNLKRVKELALELAQRRR